MSFGTSITTGPGRPRRRDVERLLHDHRNVGRAPNEEAVLHDRTRYADHVGFLERIRTDQIGRHLAGNDDHRNRVHVRGRDTGDGVGGSGAGGHEYHTGLPGRARIAVGHVRGSLLVTHQNVFDALLAEDRIVNVQCRAAGIAEDVFDAFVLQARGSTYRRRIDAPSWDPRKSHRQTTEPNLAKTTTARDVVDALFSLRRNSRVFLCDARSMSI